MGFETVLKRGGCRIYISKSMTSNQPKQIVEWVRTKTLREFIH